MEQSCNGQKQEPLGSALLVTAGSMDHGVAVKKDRCLEAVVGLVRLLPPWRAMSVSLKF